jgi:hypothetical protein
VKDFLQRHILNRLLLVALGLVIVVAGAVCPERIMKALTEAFGRRITADHAERLRRMEASLANYVGTA